MWAQAADWFARTARPLPWRREPRDPWAVLVSEVMLQQTQVARVESVFLAWLRDWPTPPDLARAAPGDAVRAWGGLGYPRRALRLHAAAVTVTERHDGRVPREHDQLLHLPGIGNYTAAAVLAFAHKRRIAVLDTNVRRVLHRHDAGIEAPASTAPTRAERSAVTASLPADPCLAATASEAVMELGALVCRARGPLCDACPLAHSCAWLGAGRPRTGATVGQQPRFEGSDRQARGRILRLVREQQLVTQSDVDAVWPQAPQRLRALQSLVADGLIEVVGDKLRLPSGA